MSKAENFISEHTRNCSNEFEPQKAPPSVYNPWLTPDQALRAVEIAKEEMMEMVVEFLSKEENIPLWDDNSGDFGCDNLLLIKKLKQTIRDEQGRRSNK